MNISIEMVTELQAQLTAADKRIGQLEDSVDQANVELCTFKDREAAANEENEALRVALQHIDNCGCRCTHCRIDLNLDELFAPPSEDGKAHTAPLIRGEEE